MFHSVRLHRVVVFRAWGMDVPGTELVWFIGLLSDGLAGVLNQIWQNASEVWKKGGSSFYQTRAKPGAALQTPLSLTDSFIHLAILYSKHLYGAVLPKWLKMVLPVINYIDIFSYDRLAKRLKLNLPSRRQIYYSWVSRQNNNTSPCSVPACFAC